MKQNINSHEYYHITHFAKEFIKNNDKELTDLEKKTQRIAIAIIEILKNIKYKNKTYLEILEDIAKIK